MKELEKQNHNERKKQSFRGMKIYPFSREEETIVQPMMIPNTERDKLQDEKRRYENDLGSYHFTEGRPNWQVGDIIPMPEERSVVKKVSAIAASFVIICLLSLTGYNLYFTQTALVSMDVNPSIEIGLNRFDRVVSVKAYDREGREMLERMKLKNSPCRKAMEQLFKSAEFKKYVKKNGNMVIAVEASARKDENYLLKELKYITPSLEANVYYFAVSKKIVKVAHTHHITPGKYMKIIELQRLDPNIKMEDYEKKSIGHICDKIEKYDAQKNAKKEKLKESQEEPKPEDQKDNKHEHDSHKKGDHHGKDRHGGGEHGNDHRRDDGRKHDRGDD